MSYRSAIAALLACAAIGCPALAAPPNAPAADAPRVRLDPLALAAADRLLTAMEYDRMMQRTIDAMLANLAPMLKKSLESRTGQPIDDELIRRLSVIQGDFLRSTLTSSPDMRRAVATIYATQFNAAELDHLAALYKDPVMRKWAVAGPAITVQMMPLVQSVMESRHDELEQRIKTAVLNYYAEKGKSPGS